MPICAAVDAILHREATLDEAIRALLARPLRREGK
jgi:glycerol-3-phosphate dehydrogenase (NAD(P)+)